VLEALADRLSDGRDVPIPALADAVRRLDQVFDVQRSAIGDVHLAIHVRGRHMLYRETAREVTELVELESESNLHG
jgi:hypothetical protein